MKKVIKKEGRAGGGEYVRADGLNSMIGSHFTFIDGKGSSPLKCLRWMKTGSGWTNKTDEDCGIGVYKNGSQPIVMDTVVENGTFENIFLDKNCFKYKYNTITGVVEKNGYSPCGIIKEGTEILQVVDNVSAKNIISQNGEVNKVIVNKLVSNTISSKTITASTELKTNLMKSLGGTITADSRMTVNQLLNLKSDLVAEGHSILSKNLTVSGDTKLSKDLTVDGDTKLSKNLLVEESVAVSKNLLVKGDSTVSGAVIVAKNASIGFDLSARHITSRGSVISKGNVTAAYTVDGTDVIATPIISRYGWVGGNIGATYTVSGKNLRAKEDLSAKRNVIALGSTTSTGYTGGSISGKDIKARVTYTRYGPRGGRILADGEIRGNNISSNNKIETKDLTIKESILLSEKNVENESCNPNYESISKDKNMGRVLYCDTKYKKWKYTEKPVFYWAKEGESVFSCNTFNSLQITAIEGAICMNLSQRAYISKRYIQTSRSSYTCYKTSAKCILSPY